jgi:hypothetical protein
MGNGHGNRSGHMTIDHGGRGINIVLSFIRNKFII